MQAWGMPILGCDAILSCSWLTTHWRNLLPTVAALTWHDGNYLPQNIALHHRREQIFAKQVNSTSFIYSNPLSKPNMSQKHPNISKKIFNLINKHTCWKTQKQMHKHLIFVDTLDPLPFIYCSKSILFYCTTNGICWNTVYKKRAQGPYFVLHR
jgi:hypothetical protein